MKRTKPPGIKNTPVRLKIISHVLVNAPHWKGKTRYMSNTFLLANCHPYFRDDLELELKQELKQLEYDN